MEGSCSTGQSPQWAVVPVEEEEVSWCFNSVKEQLLVQSYWILSHNGKILDANSMQSMSYRAFLLEASITESIPTKQHSPLKRKFRECNRTKNGSRIKR
jgi:hypothetical protein